MRFESYRVNVKNAAARGSFLSEEMGFTASLSDGEFQRRRRLRVQLWENELNQMYICFLNLFEVWKQKKVFGF